VDPEQIEPARVAGVRIDSPLAHLDRVFDYEIPAALATQVRFGSRVRLRFAGRLTNGLVVSLGDQASHTGTLRPIDRVLGPEPVLLPEVLALAESVAERMAGSVRDVLRAAIPARHARAEVRGDLGPGQPDRGVLQSKAAAAIGQGQPSIWERYRHGPSLIRRLRDGGEASGLRAGWASAPGGCWPEEVAALIDAVLDQRQGGVIVVVPDAWDVERARRAVPHLSSITAVLTADLGPERRYREFLTILRGRARVVIGTRAAVFAPLADCRAIIVWQDGDEALWDPQGPYWNARDVAAIRSHQTGCALLVGACARSVQVQQWCEQGWMRSVDPLRSAVRATGPIVRGLDEPGQDEQAPGARIPHVAWQVAKEGLRSGPVLVQVPRRGYVPALACQDCRAPATCTCGGPLAMAGQGTAPQCTWCGSLAAGWQCRSCRSKRIRAVRIGVERTAEEFGRAFPGARVVWSAGGSLRRTVGDEPALVVATFGSEPIVPSGYAAVVILDARQTLTRPGLRVIEDAAHRWFWAASLARPRAQVVVTAEHAQAVVQALLRWDSGWLAARELAERREAGLPPATRFALVSGPSAELASIASALSVPHRSLGPMADRLILTADRSDGLQLARQLRAVVATRAAKGLPSIRVMLDPREI